MSQPYPILEYDPARVTMIEPSLVIKPREVWMPACVYE
jgi:hypothetical protein